MRYITILLLLFTVTVQWPFGPKKKYRDVARVTPQGYHYELRLSDGRKVLVPVFWAIVEEQ